MPGTGARRRPRVQIHRSRSLPEAEVTTRHGIPVTTAARTVLDMAARLSESRLEHLLDEVERRELADYPALEALARAHTGHKGAAKLRATLRTYEAGAQLTRSDREILFRQLGLLTRPAAPSRRTMPATPTSPAPATARCDSPTARSHGNPRASRGRCGPRSAPPGLSPRRRR